MYINLNSSKIRKKGITSSCRTPFLEKTFASNHWNPFSMCYVISCFPSWSKEGKPCHHQPPNQWIDKDTSGHICHSLLLKICNHFKEGLRSKKGHLLISLANRKLSFLNVIIRKHQIDVNIGNHVQSWHYFLFAQTLKSNSDIISWGYYETNGNICCIYLYKKTSKYSGTFDI